MTFCEQLIEEYKPVWESFADLPFLTDMIQNRLDHAKFARYLVQDTKYLSAFAKVYAWSFLKAEDLQLMQELYQEMGVIVAGETQSHIKYLKDTGIDESRILMEETDPSGQAYMDYMLQAARHGTLAEGIYAAGPCNFSYYYLGLEIRKRMEQAGTATDNYFMDWLAYYIGEDYRQGCEHYKKLCDQVSADLSEEETERIRDIFAQCTEHERRFWIMADQEPAC